ncbi:hypothetical protein H0H81_008196 [Sphagnurus paluster]|uniref:Peptidyl-prolyl cis-trans isomerase n=1 Tax=Sphagnurus paluster TaxID=117069 RepID=A0A9P7FXG4_9AGAR|nr:hypothetical protein H0H81_008196 [Sphagnurus paluster]
MATPTLIPRQSRFPHLLPRPPQPHPVPLSHRRVYGNLNAVRDLQREMEDLSDEENEFEDIADDDSEDSGSASDGGAPSLNEDGGENDESAHDLDASMEDLDEGVTVDTDDNDEMGEGDTDFEEETSEV